MTERTAPKRLSSRAILLMPLCAGFIGMSVSLFLETQVHAAQTTGPSHQIIEGSGSSRNTPTEPDRLVIPAIGVNAKVESVGLSWKGTGNIGVPSNFTNVAWYNRGPVPGAPGNAVIDGHLDGRYVQKAVFYRLGDLKPGDAVLVEERGGTVLRFVVTGSQTYDAGADTSAIFSGDGSEANLNLITCAGDWLSSEDQYDKRIVVYTKLVQ